MHILVKTLLANEEIDKDKLMLEITPVLAQKKLKALISHLSKIYSNLDIAVSSYLEEIPFFILKRIAEFGAVSTTYMLLQQKEGTDENYTF